MNRLLAEREGPPPIHPPPHIERRNRQLLPVAQAIEYPLYPPALSEGAASLLADVWRQAVLWTIDLDATGEVVAVDVARRVVRSVAQRTYEDVPDDVAPLLREVGGLRLAIERARGGVRLAVPEQEVVSQGGGWTVSYRVPNRSSSTPSSRCSPAWPPRRGCWTRASASCAPSPRRRRSPSRASA